MKTDSKHDASLPSNRAANADDAVDFRREAPSENDVAALSGGKSGSSVLTWDELVRQQSADDEVDLASGGVKIDSASDQDILREVLAGEKPPSKIIPRSGSDPEVTVDHTPAPPPTTPNMAAAAISTETVREFPTSAPGKAPASGVNLSATRIEDDDDSFQIGVSPESAESSSILSSLGIGPSSGVQSSASTGSRVDLLAHLRPKGGSGVTSRKNLPKSPPTAPIDNAAQFGDEFGDDDQSSAVDLGSRPIVEMPFPLGVDSSVGSSVVGTSPRGGPGSSRLGGDSAAVDLMAADEFNLYRQPGMSSVADTLRGNSGHELPPTVPMAPVAMDKMLAWVGGSVIGLLFSALVFTALYFGGIVRFESEELGKPVKKDFTNIAPGNTADDTHAAYSALVGQLNKQGLSLDKLDGLKQRLAAADAAKSEANDARTKLTQVTDELQALKSAQDKQGGDAQTLQKQVAQLNDAVKRASATAAESFKTLEQTRVATQKSLREAEDRLAELRAQQDKKIAEVARALEDRAHAEAAEADAARKALAEFMHALNLKLSDSSLVAANAKPNELLAAVDKALQRRSSGVMTGGSYDSLQADRLFSLGVRAYRERDFALAERSLAEAAKANDRDARIRYMLGLARVQLGRHNDAQPDFYAAAALERQHSPSPHDVDELLARLPGNDRSIVGQYRP
jgi:hypothetical protein